MSLSHYEIPATRGACPLATEVNLFGADKPLVSPDSLQKQMDVPSREPVPKHYSITETRKTHSGVSSTYPQVSCLFLLIYDLDPNEFSVPLSMVSAWFRSPWQLLMATLSLKPGQLTHDTVVISEELSMSRLSYVMLLTWITVQQPKYLP